MDKKAKILQEVQKIVRGSVQYKIRDSILTVTGYYTGEWFSIDLSKLTEEMLEDLQPEDEEDDDYDE
jgi:hypothetical protein